MKIYSYINKRYVITLRVLDTLKINFVFKR